MSRACSSFVHSYLVIPTARRRGRTQEHVINVLAARGAAARRLNRADVRRCGEPRPAPPGKASANPVPNRLATAGSRRSYRGSDSIPHRYPPFLKRRALRAYRRFRSGPCPPPLGVVASHRISRLVTESALLSRVPYSPGLPSPQPNRPNFTSPGEKTNLTQKGPFKRVRVYRPALRPSSVAPPRADPDPHRRPAAVEHSSHGVSSSRRGSLRGLRRSSGRAATNPPPKPPVAVPYPAPRAPTPTTHQPPVT